jgi:hypothetical protein
MQNDELSRKLDNVIAILRIAYAEELTAARTSVYSDPVARAVLEATQRDFVAAGVLKSQIAGSTKQSAKTVQRRIQELVDMGALETRPTGSAAYRATGLL